MPSLRNKLKDTEKWHKSHRADPLQKFGNCSTADTQGHLSLELCPFHSVFSFGVSDFAKSYPRIVRDFVLRFAALASQKVDDEKLKNKVFVRVSPGRFLEILELIGYQVPKDEAKKVAKTKKEKWECSAAIITFPEEEWHDVEFIVTTGVRNNFKKTELEAALKSQWEQKKETKEIIVKIINLKLY